MNQLKDKVIVLTGASGGIGRVVAELLMAEKVRLIALSRQELDLTDEKAVKKVTDRILKRYGQVDALINNAGLLVEAELKSLTVKEFDEVIRVNLRAGWLMVKYLLPGLKKSKLRHVVNVSSISANKSWAGGGIYCASKAAIMRLTEAWRQELRSEKIRFSIISPGQTDTKMQPKQHIRREMMLKPITVAEMIVMVLKLPYPAYTENLIVRPLV